jgi:hypothetical protein
MSGWIGAKQPAKPDEAPKYDDPAPDYSGAVFDDSAAWTPAAPFDPSSEDQSWWGQTNRWASQQFGNDWGKKLNAALASLGGARQPANPSPAFSAVSSAIRDGGNPALGQVLAIMGQRQELLRSLGMEPPQAAAPTDDSGGLLGMK